jgi:hypothetical protein
MPNDSVETSPEMVLFLEPLIEKLKLDDRKLIVLDACYCLGQSIENWKQFDYVDLIHDQEMGLGKRLEINRNNLQYYLDLEIDAIIFNPPWSSTALAKVLDVMCQVADIKNIPFLFLISHRSTLTNRFYSVMEGKKLAKWNLPTLNFIGFNGPGILDNRSLSWYGYNLSFDVRKPQSKLIIC